MPGKDGRAGSPHVAALPCLHGAGFFFAVVADEAGQLPLVTLLVLVFTLPGTSVRDEDFGGVATTGFCAGRGCA